MSDCEERSCHTESSDKGAVWLVDRIGQERLHRCGWTEIEVLYFVGVRYAEIVWVRPGQCCGRKSLRFTHAWSRILRRADI
ncbi:MAG: hypothetical protein GY938_15135 [Ketobacter sp.]|nr:hypothetical protein [Ketobacter sp.]